MKLYQDVPHGTANYPFQVHETYCENGLSLYPHVHPEIEITIITKGSGIFYIEGKEYLVKQGDCIFISPNQIHLASSDKENNEASFYSLVFLPQFLTSDRNHLIYTKYINPILQGNKRVSPIIDCSKSWHADILRLANKIQSLYFSDDNELLCQSAILELWYHIYANSETLLSPPVNKAAFLLKDTLDYLENNYFEHITVSDLASRVNLSQSYFSKLFNQYMHTSPIDMLIKIRLYHSAQMLLNESLSVSEIALRCGFNDFSYFCKCFRIRYGCSPCKYKKI